MDAELKGKWLTALRSGEYEQGQSVLRTHQNTFCCLGVLCDVFDNTKWRDDRSYYLAGDARVGSLPGLLMRIVELDDNQVDHLIEMNDKMRSPFAEIADYIEANL